MLVKLMATAGALALACILAALASESEAVDKLMRRMVPVFAGLMLIGLLCIVWSTA